jgi:hypothetical protein
VYSLIDNPPTKDAWKREVKNAINKYYLTTLRQEMEQQSTTRYINPSKCSLSKTHPVWRYVGANTREITRATVNAKILVGVYNFQAKRSKFGREESGLCPLCGDTPETTILNEVRRPYTACFQQLVHDRV